ncbi:MAG: hypothetical protein NZ895_00365 [Archaeoglobaceae archaeon]|nr:hypothetical protein [Archaeoglobaceae archaeon]MCX8151422.1 hypothetical protein [Archaeoglobaceae archaeon]MDW8014369.1 hypothetical protein [Archaeoglobaceae archaeon]
MKLAGILLMILGSAIALIGFFNSKETILNVGVCGTFIGAVLFSFSQQKNSKFIESYHENLRNLSKFLELKKSIYIPRNKHLPDGAVFLALMEDFEIDLAKMDYERIVISGREREAGMLLKVPGSEILREVEEISFESVASALRYMGLIRSSKIVSSGEDVRILVEGVAVDFCEEYCKVLACPICSNLIFSFANESNELIEVEKFEVGEKIEIHARKIGGVERWV